MFGFGISGGGTSTRTTGTTGIRYFSPEQISRYFREAGYAAGQLPWEELMEGDWERLEQVLYEKPAARLGEEMGEMQKHLYSELSKRGVGDAPEVVSRNVAEGIRPFTQRFADIASEATAQRYGLQQQAMLQKNLGLERRMGLWYGGFKPIGEKTRGYSRSFNLSGQGSWQMQ